MRVFLTGGSGTLGTELQKHMDCFAPSRYDFDVASDRHMSSHLFEVDYADELDKVDVMVHCAAFTDVPGCEIKKHHAVNTNIIGTQRAAKYAHIHGWKFVYISTDYVYSGTSGGYIEDSETRPFNFYGFSKLAGECFADPLYDLIIRTSFKPRGLWLNKYNQAFTDIYTSADWVDIIAQDIIFAINSGISGIINIGTERKSVYELAAQENPNVSPASKHDVRGVKLPDDISMNINKLNALKKNMDKYGQISINNYLLL